MLSDPQDRSWHLVCVQVRSIIFSLPVDLVPKTKVCAAELDTTINALGARTVAGTIIRKGRARVAANRLLVLADKGPYLTTDPGAIRPEELFELFEQR